MYSILLFLHSLNRWVVLVLLLAALVLAVGGWSRRAGWTRRDDQVGTALVATMDLQLLLGLALYLFASPYVRAGLADLTAAMTDRVLQFWTVEHGPTMLVAVILVHVGRVLTRRAADDRTRHRRAAIWYGAATLVVLAAIPWPFLAYGRDLLPSL